MSAIMQAYGVSIGSHKNDSDSQQSTQMDLPLEGGDSHVVSGTKNEQ